MKKVRIIGAGPAGLATANWLQEAGFDVLLFDKGTIAENIRHFPIYMRFFSTPELLEIGGVPLLVSEEKPSRREYLQYLARFARDRKLRIRAFHSVERVVKNGSDGFTLSIQPRDQEPFDEKAEIVVVATGAYATPRYLHVPGENLAKVRHHFDEPHPYVGSKVLVVGGGNSAAETALLLFRSGADVTVSYRGKEFKKIKYWLRPDLENRIKAGEIRAFLGSNVVEIKPQSVALRLENSEIEEIENDFVLALTGYEPELDLLRQAGVEFEPNNRKPKLNYETMESSVPGLFVVGVVVAGNISGEIFIENSRHHGELVARELLSRNKNDLANS